ncbi:MAG: Flp pilus assembly protein CpaB [Desulfobacteraceae bacterium]|jgi:Flp pilus assembly protein CpaB
MRKFRGLIALVLSIVLGLIAARAVYWYLNRPKPQQKPVQVVAPAPEKSKTLSQRIPEGMRVVAVQVDSVSGLAGKIEKGDWVDVLATSTIPKKPGAAITRVVLQGVEVYDAGDKDSAPSSKVSRKEREWPVSLLVRPDQAPALIAAAETARIRLIARNEQDLASLENLPTAFSYDSGVQQAGASNRGVLPVPGKGMRAFTLVTRDTDGVLGVLRPRDRVDVMVTCPISKFATGGETQPGAKGKVTETSMSSRVLLQNVEILATERALNLSVGREGPVHRVTLLVTPAQARILTVVSDATSKSIIRFVSRNPDDPGRTPGGIVHLSDLLAVKLESLQVDIIKGEQRDYRVFSR